MLGPPRSISRVFNSIGGIAHGYQTGFEPLRSLGLLHELLHEKAQIHAGRASRAPGLLSPIPTRRRARGNRNTKGDVSS